ncbi:hypothetical protein Gorai_023348 [Gossypium raimondii]|uniref:Uncharacterized protein n=1 Tax=Gossypium raimondii TaxID=29730 RepID=A0A7J8NW53_GOSRA|nr:hypothetical protein [Gossypium raimondii]
MVGKVAKSDMSTNNRAKGWFAQMAIYVNLDRALTDMESNAGILPSDINESTDIRRNKGKRISNGPHQSNEIFGHNNGQLGSGALDKGQLNELGFRNTVGPIRVNSVASRSSIGPVSSSKRTNGFRIVDDRFSEGLTGKKNGLDLNGPLGVKASSILDKAVEGSEQ